MNASSGKSTLYKVNIIDFTSDKLCKLAATEVSNLLRLALRILLNSFKAVIMA